MTYDLARIKHVVLDLDGTLYRGDRLFDVTIPFLATLNQLGLGYTFLTNNTSKSKVDYVSKLKALGIEATPAQVTTPADPTITYLREQLEGVHSIGVLGTESLQTQFREAGFLVTWDSPDAVVVGFDTTLTYENLCNAAYWIGEGRPFIATHPDLVCPTDLPTILVDCGALCAALTAATGREPVVLGKPDPAILLDLCRRHHLQPVEAIMVGDRIYTDMAMAKRAKTPSALVLSGEATRLDAEAMQDPPDLVVEHVGELGARLTQAISAGAQR